MRYVCAAVVCLVAVSGLFAERPPERRGDAVAVFTGEVVKIEKSDKKFGGDGTTTTYTAEVKVSKVEKGDAKVGDTVKVTWFNVTKRPTRPLPGAYGQNHKLAEKDVATFWASTGEGKGPYALNYSSDAVEKAKK